MVKGLKGTKQKERKIVKGQKGRRKKERKKEKKDCPMVRNEETKKGCPRKDIP